MSGKILGFFFAVFAVFLCSNGFALDPIVLPEGWRLPTEKELGHDWRSESESKYAIAAGDFDGNGKTDYALQLVDSKSNDRALVVSLCRNDGSYSYIMLGREEADWLESMGIDKVAPGKYKTACGKGAWPCEDGEPAEIALAHDSIDYFRIEGAASYIFWDDEAEAFRRIWISD